MNKYKIYNNNNKKLNTQVVFTGRVNKKNKKLNTDKNNNQKFLSKSIIDSLKLISAREELIRNERLQINFNERWPKTIRSFLLNIMSNQSVVTSLSLVLFSVLSDNSVSIASDPIVNKDVFYYISKIPEIYIKNTSIICHHFLNNIFIFSSEDYYNYKHSKYYQLMKETLQKIIEIPIKKYFKNVITEDLIKYVWNPHRYNYWKNYDTDIQFN